MKLSLNKVKINPLAIKRLLRNLPQKIFSRVFWLFFFLIALDLIIGAFVFYRFTFLIEKQDIQPAQSVKLQKELLNEVIGRLKQREQAIKEADNRAYSDIFSPRVETGPVEEENPLEQELTVPEI